MSIETSGDLIRIAKFISDCGLCSRREAERLIAEDRVMLNGRVLDSPAVKVNIDEDEVRVDGQIIIYDKNKQERIWLLNKPLGYITSNVDPQNRHTVFDLLPKDMPRVVSVGRLDFNTEGLLLFTNSGALARSLELPSSKIPRTYLVKAYGKSSVEKIKALAPCTIIKGIRYNIDEIKIISGKKTEKQWKIEITLFEGKNREVRKLMTHLGLQVSKLRRISYGSISLQDEAIGAVRELTKDEIQSLKALIAESQ